MRLALSRRLALILVALGLVFPLAAAPVLAAALSVNSLADTAADDGVCTLREAIAAANTDTTSGATLGECAAGSGADVISFTVAGTITLASALPDITSDLSVNGAGAITISGASAFRVFLIQSGTVTLSGLTITGGSANFGAGIAAFPGSTVTVTNSTVSGNAAGSNGGGLSNNGTMTITNSIVSGNTSGGDGGGILVTPAATLTIIDSTISGNTAVVQGGGIWNNGTTILTGSTFSGNSAGSGGGILNWIADLTVTNSTFSGNTANTTGGGIATFGNATVTNATFNENSAGDTGGGIYNEGTATVTNALLVGEVPSAITNSGTLNFTTSHVAASAAGILDPAGLANNGGPTQTIALDQVAGNPAIDTGTSAVCAAAPVNGVDQRGLPRPAACDIGAYEIQPPLPDAAMAQPQPSGTPLTLGFGLLLVGSLSLLLVANARTRSR